MSSVWTGTISTGLLSLPVKLHPAVSKEKSRVHQVRKADGSRITMRRFAVSDGTEVPYSDLADGYETDDGRIVMITDADYDQAYGEAARNAKVLFFTDASGLPRTVHEASYLAEPGKNAEQAYALLAATLKDKGKAAVVEFTMRKRESLAVLYATDDGYLVLERLQWHSDVNKPSFAAPALQGGAEGLQRAALAADLVDTLTGPLALEKYSDAGAARLAAIVAGKEKAGLSVGAPAAAAAVPVLSLDEALRQSVAAAKAAKAPAPARTRKPRARAA